ncbi:amino acid adenylation domain-containing protein [Streptomyces sp. NPDC020141]|uniref:amino acid adenylation domain-containing protein n=1 Tax=Streptomyces sp. NPDC020141 TaxID=3365065 RepID=UPI003789D073
MSRTPPAAPGPAPSGGAADSPAPGAESRPDTLTPAPHGGGAAPDAPVPAPDREPRPDSPAPGTPAEPAVSAPLTDLQHAYWVGEQGAYDLSTAARLHLDWELPELDEAALRRALDACSARHPMLRARVRADGAQSVDANRPIPLIVREDAAEGERDPEARLRADRAEASAALPPLSEGPPLAAVLVRTPGAVRLTLVLRLFAFDAASVGILLRDLAAFHRDAGLRLPPPGASFLDFARREERRAGRARRDAEAYWAARIPELPGPPELPLAAGGPPPDSASFRRHVWTLDAGRSARLRSRARARGLSVNAVLCSAYASVLSRFCGQDAFTLTVLASRRPATARHAEVIGNHGTTVALAVPPAPGASFAERARLLQERLHEAYGHSAVSGIEVLRRMKALGANAPELLPVVFASSVGLPGGGPAPDGGDTGAATGAGSGPERAEEPPGLPGARPLGGALHTPQVWIDHQVYEDGPGIGCTVDLVEDVFPEGFTAAFLAVHRQWLDLLTDAEDRWDEPIRPLLPEAQTAARRAANSTARPLPARLLHDGFDERRRRDPGRTALIHGAERVGYGDLWAEAAALAARLAAQGVRPGDLVAVRAAKGRRQIAAVLAVLHAGGAYVPLAPSTPPRRLAKVIRHAGIRLVLTDDPGGLGPDPGAPALDLRTATARTSPAPAGPGHRASPDDLAYVIYTSGTTGEPKGVAVEHRAAMNTIDDLLERFALGPGDRTLQLSSLGFDLSVFDVFGTLAAGGAIVVPADGPVPDPVEWTSLVREHRVTVWNSVPALLDMALHAGGPYDRLDSLRLVMLSGDWIPLGLPARIREHAPDALVAALGGATEAAIWSNIHLPGPRPLPGWTSVPYGAPLANQGFHVLDGELADAPDWVPGDLVITGAGLARGYHHAPEQTAAAFRRHPETGERMYFTGDRARYRPDGTLEFLGRADTQVKVRGHRIELAEVASAALELPGVRAAVADVLGERPDEQRLALFVACDPADRTGLAEKARAAARESLPPYMVPADVVLLDALPVTSNGKVDRAALRRAAAPAAARSGAGSPPFPGTETVLAGIWEAVLGAPVNDRAADFFDLGGTSLLAARMVGRIETALGVRPVLSGLFRHSTLAGQARLVEEAGACPARCAAVLREEPGAPRLVLFHPVGGGLLCYRELVAALPEARHVVGVQSPPVRADEPDGRGDPGDRPAPGDGVTALAARYAAELRAELAPGPVVFAGWSMGGVLALETARLLRDSPLDVTRVVALDSYVAAEPGAFVHTGPAAERAFLADLRGGSGTDRTAAPDGDPPPERPLPPELHDPYRAYLANYRALLTHRPAPPQDVPVLAVRFRDSAPDAFPGLVPLTDHWRELPPGVRVQELPGHHFAVADPLRRGALADLLTPQRPATEKTAVPTAREERGNL